MALDFPSSPTNGQTYTSGSVTWVYDGTKWVIQGASGVYLPITGGVLASPGNLTVRGGILVGAAGAVPAAGALTLNANTVAPPGGNGAGGNLYVVAGDNNFTIANLDCFGTGSPIYVTRRSRGTAAAPTAVQAGDTLGGMAPYGRGATAYQSRGNITFAASENWTDTAQGTTLYLSTNAAGGTAAVNSLTLAGNLATFSGSVAAGNAIGIGPGNPVGLGNAQRLSVGGPAGAGFGVAWIGGGPTGSDTTTILLVFGDAAAATYLGSINRNGTNAVAYITSSDARLKENLVESEIGLDAVMQLKVYDFNWKGAEEPSHGLLAQEVYGVYPHAVSVGGEDPVEKPWGMDHGRLTPLLIRAIQQLKAELDALKAKA